jgi:hypothetical protein
MRAALNSMMAWAKTHERHLSAIAMAGGFAFDSYAFGRIDRPMTQLVFIVYLAAAGGCLAVLHMWESRPQKSNPRSHAILVAAMQFALGALLSGFCVFYIRSAAIVASWPFLLFMAAIFIGNEYFRAYASRLVFAALLFFLHALLLCHFAGAGTVGAYRTAFLSSVRRHRDCGVLDLYASDRMARA